MINIKLYWDKNFLTGIESSGHSGYADNGKDIICAAVSSLVQAL
ncbi:MAG: ribosomal-processing cysteine protease Prp, partial [Synergistaceae bacterium]|nr:ribosomal-processing cysteine protease Prp [Synergistaceae bacterium]